MLIPVLVAQALVLVELMVELNLVSKVDSTKVLMVELNVVLKVASMKAQKETLPVEILGFLAQTEGSLRLCCPSHSSTLAYHLRKYHLTEALQLESKVLSLLMLMIEAAMMVEGQLIRYFWPPKVVHSCRL